MGATETNHHRLLEKARDCVRATNNAFPIEKNCNVRQSYQGRRSVFQMGISQSHLGLSQGHKKLRERMAGGWAPGSTVAAHSLSIYSDTSTLCFSAYLPEPLLLTRQCKHFVDNLKNFNEG